MDGQQHATATLSPERAPWRIVEGTVWTQGPGIAPTFEPWTVQPVMSSHVDYAIPACRNGYSGVWIMFATLILILSFCCSSLVNSKFHVNIGHCLTPAIYTTFPCLRHTTLSSPVLYWPQLCPICRFLLCEHVCRAEGLYISRFWLLYSFFCFCCPHFHSWLSYRVTGLPLISWCSNILLHVDVIVRWSLNLKFAGCVCALIAYMWRAGIEQL